MFRIHADSLNTSDRIDQRLAGVCLLAAIALGVFGDALFQGAWRANLLWSPPLSWQSSRKRHAAAVPNRRTITLLAVGTAGGQLPARFGDPAGIDCSRGRPADWL
jgi:hypothetical protein